MSFEVGSIVAKMGVETAEFDRKIDRSRDKFKDAGEKMGKVGSRLSIGLTLPLVGIGIAAFNSSKQFNTAMANVATLIPGNTKRVTELKSAVQDMAIATGQSTDNLAGGLYQVLSAFGDTADSAKDLEINARAAAAGLATTTDAINLTSAVTKGYNDTSKEAIQHAADLGLLTVRLGQTTFPELAASIGQVVPLAQNLNVTQEELFATMATFTGVTGHASEVSTQLRGALQSLMAPTTDAERALRRQGFTSGAAAVKQLGLAGAIKLLTAEAKRTGKPLQDYISSIEGQTIALGLAGSQSKDYKSKLEQMGKAAGTTDAAFKEVTSGVNKAGFQWEQTKVKASVFAQRLGDKLAPALSTILDQLGPLIDKLGQAVDWFTALDPVTQKWVVGLAALGIAMGPVLSFIGQAVELYRLFVPAITAATAAQVEFDVAANANPLGLIVAIIAAIIGVAYVLVRYWRPISGFFIGIWQHIWSFMKGVGAWFAGPFTRFFVSAGRAIAAPFLWFWHSVLVPFGRGAAAVFNFIARIVSSFAHLFVFFFRVLITPLIAGTMQILRALGAVGMWLWRSIFAPVLRAIGGQLAILGGNFAWLYNVAIAPIVHAIAGVITWLWDKNLHPFISMAGSALHSFGDGVMRVFRGIGSVIKGAFTDAVNGAKQLINVAIGYINNFISFIDMAINGLNKVPGVNFPTIPQIPHLAQGGIVQPTAGGRTVVMGDGGEVEYGIPESRLVKLIEQARATGRGGGDGGTLTVVFTGTGVMRGVRKTVRHSGGDTTALVGV
jgi:TP901 family phage tail tape measure protein